MRAVRADRWGEAETLATKAADPVAGKLVAYFRLLAPETGSAPEIARFMAENPDWPNRATLERRRQEALAREPDQAMLIAECDRSPLQVTAALLRCAEAYTAAARPADAARAVRLAWTGGIVDPADEAGFLRRWAALLTPEDQRERFAGLVWRDLGAAARQVPRLASGEREAAQAWLALRRDEPTAAARLAAIPAPARDDPNLVLDEAAWLRRRDRPREARDLWLARGAEAEAAAPADRRPAFWSERNLLARRLLQTGDDRGAYAVVAAHRQDTGEPPLEAEFLAGFVALRRLHEPETAIRHFNRLASASDAAITQGRAQYWLGRAEAEAGRSPEAAFGRAAAWPTTFYGQLAALARDGNAGPLAARLRAERDPAWTRDQALDFAGTELVRAAGLLVGWGEPRRAHGFLLRADQRAAAPAERALAAHLALGLGIPDVAVAIARRMGRDGLMLPEAGWPAPVEPPSLGLDPALVLGLIRQESSFDPQAVSRSGARGLMQLMPATAQAVQATLGSPAPLAALTDDPPHNMLLGGTYLRGLLDRFGGSLPLAVAAYNAGPRRVKEWLAVNGDPRGPGVDMLDWIELIPIGETRNYVQRVIENAVVYRARTGDPTPALLAAGSNP